MEFLKSDSVIAVNVKWSECHKLVLDLEDWKECGNPATQNFNQKLWDRLARRGVCVGLNTHLGYYYVI